MRAHDLPLLSSIRLNQPSGGHSFTLWNITFSPSLRYHGSRYKKIFFWSPLFDSPPPPTTRTLRGRALIDFHFSYVLSAEKEINIPQSTYSNTRGASSRYSCTEKRCSWVFYDIWLCSVVASLWITTLEAPSHTCCLPSHSLDYTDYMFLYVSIDQRNLLKQGKLLPIYCFQNWCSREALLSKCVLFVLQACQGASWWAGSGHFLDYWLLGGGGPGKLFLLCGKW